MSHNQDHISFFKIHGAGNDFVLFDNRVRSMSDRKLAELALQVCDRKFGVGSDGLIALSEKDGMLLMQYKNPDGSDAGMCGNGARCFARLAKELGYDSSVEFNVHDKIYQSELHKNGDVIISFPLETKVKPLHIDGQDIFNVYTNTEHIVCPVNSQNSLSDQEELKSRGKTWRHHNRFQPKGTNVNFINGIDRETIELQTYERGVENLTLACGTGAIASALAWHHLASGTPGNHQYDVKTRGGMLTVSFTFTESENHYTNIRLKGPTEIVFTGTFYI